MRTPSRRVVSTMKRVKSKRSSSITWLVFVAIVIMFGMVLFIHSERLIAYSDIANRVKHSAESIPKFYHNIQRFADLEGRRNASVPEDMTMERTAHYQQTQQDKVPQTKRMSIAFAITITRDGPFQDGAAVMLWSILQAFGQDDLDISFVSFVHPNVTTSRPLLRKIGYR